MKEYKITLSAQEMNTVYQLLRKESAVAFADYIMYRDEGFDWSAEECERNYERIEVLLDKFYIDED